MTETLETMQIIGVDIGGANLKAASVDGQAASRAFAIWRDPERLAEELSALLDELTVAEAVAVTMTAELADCFGTKEQGVRRILDAVHEVAAGRPVVVWQTGGEFVSVADAVEIPRLVSAANWHALATFAGRLASDGHAVLLDVGTTTTDIIPLTEGVPVPSGLTDRERLECGELVYTGVVRSPVCSIVSRLTVGGRPVEVAAELFATTGDVYLLTGDRDENPGDLDTANGEPATRTAAAGRLARMICCDTTELDDGELMEMATEIAEKQFERITAAVDGVVERAFGPGTCDTVLLSGSGAFLARRLAESHPRLSTARLVDLAECFSGPVATAACAYATARLAQERAAEFF